MFQKSLFHKLVLLICFVIVFAINRGFSQDKSAFKGNNDSTEITISKNLIYIELLGNNVFSLASLNYERKIYQFKNRNQLFLRIGGISPLLMANYSIFIKKKSHLVFGAGVAAELSFKQGTESTYASTFLIGYRHYNPTKGFMYSINYTPYYYLSSGYSSVIDRIAGLVYFGFSLGYAF